MSLRLSVPIRRSALGLAFALVLPVPGLVEAIRAQTDSREADSLAIMAAATAFSRAYERGDAATMTGIYTSDAVIFPDRSEAIAGPEAIKRYWTLRPGNRVVQHRMTSLALTMHGSYAHEYGVYQVSGEQDGQPWGPARGKYVVVWRKDSDGRWRMQLDIWNRRAPTP